MPNPLHGKNINEFFPPSRKIVIPVDAKKYFTLLQQVANNYINSNFSKKVLDKEIDNQLSTVHPFLEISGALRTQIPLPENINELYVLTQVILGGEENKLNTDKYHFTAHGMLDPKWPSALHIKMKAYAITGLSMLLCDDATSISKVNPKPFTNLLLLLASILYQQIDLQRYGARGRYGYATVKRIGDGHGIEQKSGDPHRMLANFAYNKAGMPVGFAIHACFTFKNIPAMYTHYGFTPADPPTLAPDEKAFFQLLINNLAYGAKYVHKTDFENILMVAHTDKTMAAKSTCSSYPYFDPQKASTLDAIAKYAYDIITPNPTLMIPVQDNDIKNRFNALRIIDISTVPENDPGEEVPFGGDRFYKAVYPIYRKYVLQQIPNAKVPEKILNGKVTDADFAAVEEQFSLKTGSIIKWLQTKNSCRYTMGRKQIQFAAVDKDGTVNDYYMINDKQAHMYLRFPAAANITPDQKLTNVVNEIIIKKAKQGNTANQTYKGNNTTVTRMTNLAYLFALSCKGSVFENLIPDVTYDLMVAKGDLTEEQQIVEYEKLINDAADYTWTTDPSIRDEADEWNDIFAYLNRYKIKVEEPQTTTQEYFQIQSKL